MLGLRWCNVNLDKRIFTVVEQLPYKLLKNTTVIDEMAPVKGKGEDGPGERALPITDEVLPYFLWQLALQERQKEMAPLSGSQYYDNPYQIAVQKKQWRFLIVHLTE